MVKKMEKADGRSCWNKAAEDELVFVLLARDPAAPAAIDAWIEERVRLGKNEPGDHQLQEAARAAEVMAAYSKKVAAGESPCIVCGFPNAQVCQVIGHTYPTGLLPSKANLRCVRCKRPIEHPDVRGKCTDGKEHVYE